MADMSKELHFEEGIRRLDEISAELDKGSVDLEEAIALYKEGCSLASLLDKRLNEAERTIRMAVLHEDGSANGPDDPEPVSVLDEELPESRRKRSRAVPERASKPSPEKPPGDLPDLLPF